MNLNSINNAKCLPFLTLNILHLMFLFLIKKYSNSQYILLLLQNLPHFYKRGILRYEIQDRFSSGITITEFRFILFPLN